MLLVLLLDRTDHPNAISLAPEPENSLIPNIKAVPV
jgi:hypothetical protein